MKKELSSNSRGKDFVLAGKRTWGKGVRGAGTRKSASVNKRKKHSSKTRKKRAVLY